jgi:acetoin utilization protein AcuB
METSVESVHAGESADAAWELMRLHGIHHLVVTRGADVVGVISDGDLGGRSGRALRVNRSVDDLMTDNVVVAKPETTLRQAANLMRGRSIGCLPVLDGDRVVGIVTVTDLLEALGRGVERPVERGRRWTLAGRARRPKRAAR